jgi:RNA polymerase sigma factor for flagellar operon FliA
MNRRAGLKAYEQQRSSVSLQERSKEDIFTEFQPRIMSIARRLADKIPSNIPLAMEDLVSYGAIGLLEAIERFDASRNNQFNTFADYRIRGAMRDAIRSFDSMSRHRRDQEKSVRKTEDFLCLQLGRDPLPSEVASELGVSLSEYFHLKNNTMKVVESSTVVNSFNQEEKILVELLESNGIDPLELILDEEFRQGVRHAIDELGERSRQCVLLYYGRNLNLSEIAKVFEITPSRVSQILSKARKDLMLSLREIAEDAGYDVSGT